jgi:hypothetical protein
MMNRLSTVGDRIARRLSGLVVRDAGPQQKPPLRLASRRLLPRTSNGALTGRALGYRTI